MAQPSVDVRSIGTCVSAVVSSFVDATKLVERIKAFNDTITDEAVLDLENSLSIAPPIVQGQYEQNFLQFGNSYEAGDHDARETLKDIVINLQLSLLATLRVALLENTLPDFTSLQTASDNGRLDAMMCLYRLGQRISMTSLQEMVSSSPSTKPSMTILNSDSMRQDIRRRSISQSVSSYNTRPHQLSPVSPLTETSFARPLSPFSASSRDTMHSADTKPTMSHSSRLAEYDTSMLPIQEMAARTHSMYSESVYSERSLRPLMVPQTFRGGDRSSMLGPNRYGPYGREPSIQENVAADQSASSSRSGSLVSGLPSHNKRISASSDEKDTFGLASRSIFSFSRKAPSSQSESIPSSSGGRPATATGPEKPLLAGLYLPNEENKFAGFCKGAWKLQNAMKKSFRLDSRPTSTWRCTKCHFAGALSQAPSVSRKSPLASVQGLARAIPVTGSSSQEFDQRVRLHEPSGIRYRWAFLAKSHIALKTTPKATDGTSGSFGCIYCCVEQRGPAPVFANLDMFMEHLRIHGGSAGGSADARETQMPPQAVLDWTKCILGRVASEDEGFDINIPKVVAEIGG
ncbi:hypothetical protein PRK78_004653 [Emydomyces testavorans]|uniref:Uncharacterized protein n=1 Tax=Emydomyces testavorans TaxID=2070801 RepID=A0AAF0DI51_9EURO|nr:hypothetical protein PRK78_004653 [Emydomyces testavorans]